MLISSCVCCDRYDTKITTHTGEVVDLMQSLKKLSCIGGKNVDMLTNEHLHILNCVYPMDLGTVLPA